MGDGVGGMLSGAQRAALDHVRRGALEASPSADDRIATVLGAAGVTAGIDRLVDDLAASTRVAINFHPDRIGGDGRVVAEALFRDGLYRSQFETRISNGSLTAIPGGDRDRWEQALFGGAYQQHGVTPAERPKYGGLDLSLGADGPCPRFGSCHLRLRPEVARRTTFCVGDSHAAPSDLGTLETLAPVLAGLAESSLASGQVLGRPLTVADLVILVGEGPRPWMSGAPGRALDAYVEAQVHGPVRLNRDVEAVVVDPSFAGTEVGDVLVSMASAHGLDLCWHQGFELAASAVPEAFRGPEVTLLALRVATAFGDGGTLDAEVIGRAARSVVTETDRWSDWATAEVTLQQLKMLWHVLVRLGEAPVG